MGASIHGGVMIRGNVSDYIGARALLAPLTAEDWMLADRGYDADWFREELKERHIEPCIPSRSRQQCCLVMSQTLAIYLK